MKHLKKKSKKTNVEKYISYLNIIVKGRFVTRIDGERSIVHARKIDRAKMSKEREDGVKLQQSIMQKAHNYGKKVERGRER